MSDFTKKKNELDSHLWIENCSETLFRACFVLTASTLSGENETVPGEKGEVFDVFNDRLHMSVWAKFYNNVFQGM